MHGSAEAAFEVQRIIKRAELTALVPSQVGRSFFGKTGKWRACGWAVVQLDCDEETEPLYGMCGSMEAEHEVQRTIKRAKLTAFFCRLRKVIGPIKVHVDNKGIIDGLRKGEKQSIKPRAGDADLWKKTWEELHGLAERGIMVEVEHVKAHRTTEEKKKMSHFEKFVTEGNEKDDELAKEGALVDKGFMAESRAESMQQEREEVYAALQYVASFHCKVEEWKDCEELKPEPKEKWTFVDQQMEETKHRTEWCAEADRYRCVGCGRGSKCMKMPGQCTGPKFLSKRLGKWRRCFLGGHDVVKRVDGQGEVLIL